jgi:hypothetical protein
MNRSRDRSKTSALLTSPSVECGTAEADVTGEYSEEVDAVVGGELSEKALSETALMRG